MSPRKCKEIDQMYLNVYYFRCAAGTGSGHVLSIPPRPWFASSALVDPISKTFVAALEDFARRASANRLKTCHRFGRSAFRPPDVFWMSKKFLTIARLARTRLNAWFVPPRWR